MQPLVDDVLDLRLGQLAQHRVDPVVRLRAAAVGARQPPEMMPDLVLAMQQRARAGAVQDQEMRDLPRAVLAAVGPVERPIGRQRPQQRRPLVGVDRAADHVGGRQQHVVFDVEQPRGVVAALEIVAEVQEVVAVVLQVRALGRPAQQRPLALGPVAELRQQRRRTAAAARARAARDRRRSARPTSRWSARSGPPGRSAARSRCRR